MRQILRMFALSASVLIGAALVPGQLTGQEAALTYEAAKEAAEAAEAEARANGWNVTIVVADAEGIPVYLKRLTGASARSYDIAMRKARTSASSGMTTQEYGEEVEAERIQPMPDAITFAGGVPIIVDGETIGAIGTSGVQAVQDEQVSQAGVDALGG